MQGSSVLTLLDRRHRSNFEAYPRQKGLNSALSCRNEYDANMVLITDADDILLQARGYFVSRVNVFSFRSRIYVGVILPCTRRFLWEGIEVQQYPRCATSYSMLQISKSLIRVATYLIWLVLGYASSSGSEAPSSKKKLSSIHLRSIIFIKRTLHTIIYPFKF